MRKGFAGLIIWLLAWNAVVDASTLTEMRLLDNRFRIDPSIEQITFVIYREKPSAPVILVKPNGEKLYAWKHPDNVSWHQESDMDIVSILNPMPGPWQAIGKVIPKNKIKFLSDISLKVDQFSDKYYEDEIIKFTSRLVENDEPVFLREFLDRLELKVNFIKYTEMTENQTSNTSSQGYVVGQFFDNGQDLDEKAGDGVFTVSMTIKIPPGKYLAKVTSGNGVFFRTLEKEVFVYPSPVTAKVVQVEDGELRKLEFMGDKKVLAEGSMAVHAEITTPQGDKVVYQAIEEKGSENTAFIIQDSNKPGQYSWTAWLYANTLKDNRPLVFKFNSQTFAVADFSAIEKIKREREIREAEKLEEEKIQIAQEKKAEDRKFAVLAIVGGNLFLLMFAALLWLIIWDRHKKKTTPSSLGLESP